MPPASYSQIRPPGKMMCVLWVFQKRANVPPHHRMSHSCVFFLEAAARKERTSTYKFEELLKNDQPHRQLETRKEENVLSRKQRRPHLTRAPRKEVAREVGRSSTVSSTAPRRISALSPICHQVGGTIGCNAPSIEKGKCVSALLRTEQGQRFNGVIHLTESELDLVKVS